MLKFIHHMWFELTNLSPNGNLVYWYKSCVLPIFKVYFQLVKTIYKWTWEKYLDLTLPIFNNKIIYVEKWIDI